MADYYGADGYPMVTSGNTGTLSDGPQGGGGGFPLGSWLLGGFKGIGNFFTGRENNKTQKEIAQMQIDAARQRQQADIAAKESELDPFRQLMSQGHDLSRLDMMQNTKPTQAYGISNPQFSSLAGNATPYDRSQPRQPTYAPSPDLLNWLAMIKQNVAGGQNQAPTMTDPRNYGKTSALDLLSLQSGGPQAAAYARGANQSPLPTAPTAPRPGGAGPGPPNQPPGPYQGYPTDVWPPVP